MGTIRFLVSWLGVARRHGFPAFAPAAAVSWGLGKVADIFDHLTGIEVVAVRMSKGWFCSRGKVTAEAALHITGISIPFGGLQRADPGPSDGERVRHFLVFLEDQHEEFRFFDGRHEPDMHSRRAAPEFFVALGALRATVGQQVALIAGHYDINVDGNLATILPRKDGEE